MPKNSPLSIPLLFVAAPVNWVSAFSHIQEGFSIYLSSAIGNGLYSTQITPDTNVYNDIEQPKEGYVCKIFFSGKDKVICLNLFCPDDNSSIQLKRWQVIFRAQVGNR